MLEQPQDVEAVFILLCEAHESGNQERVAAVSQQIACLVDKLLTVSCLVNAAVRKHTDWPAIFPFRVVMSTVPFLPNVKAISFDYFGFEEAYDTIVCATLNQCKFLNSLSFLFCTGMTNELWKNIADCIVNHESIMNVAIPPSRYRSEVERRDADQIKKFVCRKVGASTEVVKHHEKPLSELAVQSSATTTNSNITSLGAFRMRGEASAGDCGWAENVFRNFRIPLASLFDFEGRRKLRQFIDKLRNGTPESKVQGNEIEQARLFLLRDPTLEARVSSSRRPSKRLRIELLDEENGDADYSSAIEVLRDCGLSLVTVRDDPLAVETKVSFLRRKGKDDEAQRLEKAAICVRRSRFAVTTAPEMPLASQSQPSLWSSHGSDQTTADHTQWAYNKLQEFGLVADDVTGNTARWANVVHSLTTNNALSALNDLKRAGNVFIQLPHQQNCANVSNEELTNWANQVLCKAFQISDVWYLDHLGSEEVDAVLDMLESDRRVEVQTALRIRRRLSLGHGPADDDIQFYRQRVA